MPSTRKISLYLLLLLVAFSILSNAQDGLFYHQCFQVPELEPICVIFNHTGCQELLLTATMGSREIYSQKFPLSNFTGSGGRVCFPISEQTVCQPEACISTSGFQLTPNSLSACLDIKVSCSGISIFNQHLCQALENCDIYCMNNCSGRGVCNSGTCECNRIDQNSQYYGLDCSSIVSNVQNLTCISGPFTNDKNLCTQITATSCSSLHVKLRYDSKNLDYEIDLNSAYLSQSIPRLDVFCNLTGICDVCLFLKDVRIQNGKINICPTFNFSCFGQSLGQMETGCFTQDFVQNCKDRVCPNNCSQHGSCSEQKGCLCDRNYYGSDCSLKVQDNCITTGLNARPICAHLETRCPQIRTYLSNDLQSTPYFELKLNVTDLERLDNLPNPTIAVDNGCLLMVGFSNISLQNVSNGGKSFSGCLRTNIGCSRDGKNDSIQGPFDLLCFQSSCHSEKETSSTPLTLIIIPLCLVGFIFLAFIVYWRRNKIPHPRLEGFSVFSTQDDNDPVEFELETNLDDDEQEKQKSDE